MLMLPKSNSSLKSGNCQDIQSTELNRLLKSAIEPIEGKSISGVANEIVGKVGTSIPKEAVSTKIGKSALIAVFLSTDKLKISFKVLVVSTVSEIFP